MNAIEITNLEKVYTEGKAALSEVSLAVPEGTVFGFLGPNGAGKTTTVKLLNGILMPTQGEMKVLGLDPTVEAEKIHQFSGVLTEHAGMYDHLTGIENLLFFGQLFGLAEAESKKRGLDLLEKLELLDAADRKLSSYSTGMRQRLSLARTLIHQPKVLFLDEPTSGLDPESTKSVNKLLLELSKNSGVTVFLCTHQLRYAQEICDEYGLMDNGRLLATGNLADLRRRTFDGFKVTIKADQMPADVVAKKLQADVYEVSLQKEEEIPALVKKITMNGGNIYQVTPNDYSLEDIYFALLGKRGNDHDE